MVIHADRATYRAVVERNGRGWTVTLSGLNGGVPSFHARDLADVEPRARRLIWGHTGAAEERIKIEVQVQLPAAIEDRLYVVGQLCEDIDTEREAVVRDLAGMGVSRLDAVRTLEMRGSAPRPLTITNAELAEHGLDRHAGAAGVEWDDHSFALTRLCGRHVEAIRRTYRALDPEGRSVLVYGGEFVCDRCHEGDDDSEGSGL